ncbi:MAG: trimethylamine methyltransferase family protein [bacterium]|nr:trimethylamine methyltransferase family protein [bacterium]
MSARPQGRRRRAVNREERQAANIAQRPFRQVTYRYKPQEIPSADQVEAIHRTALQILKEIGFKVLSDRARNAYAFAGFDVDEASQLVQFDPNGLEALVSKAPVQFELAARNPAHTLKLGGPHAVFTGVGGPAYVSDLDKGRRAGTYAEVCDFMRLIQSLNIMHQEGGGGFEALDLPAETRHLDLFYACCTLTDKNWQPWGMGRAQAMDAINMAAISHGKTTEELQDFPVFTCIINTNSPLQLDIPMAEGLMTMAEYGQCVVVTPFTLSGAMSPVTLAGALAQQHAEALAGIALTQIVRPGAPAMYGGFTSNVDMKTGSPAFGTPEYAQAAQASGQLARHIGVPFRSSNVTSANANDAQAAYESMMSLWGAMTGQANMINHAAGWLGGGLVASFEKLIIDAEMLQMMAAYMEPFEVDSSSLALEAVRDVGPAGHFFGTAHTMERYETAFNAPLVSNWDNYETWIERGAPTAEVRANEIWKQLLKDYERPPIDPGIHDALKDYVARAKEEGRVVLG